MQQFIVEESKARKMGSKELTELEDKMHNFLIGKQELENCLLYLVVYIIQDGNKKVKSARIFDNKKTAQKCFNTRVGFPDIQRSLYTVHFQRRRWTIAFSQGLEDYFITAKLKGRLAELLERVPSTK